MHTFDAENLPSNPATWPLWDKVPTSAMRIDGPFTVQTPEGPLTCDDGWLAVDARRQPYPIAADEFTLSYIKLLVATKGRRGGGTARETAMFQLGMALGVIIGGAAAATTGLWLAAVLSAMMSIAASVGYYRRGAP